MSHVTRNDAMRSAQRQYDNASTDESNEQPLEEWFAELPDATRAELLYEFVGAHRWVCGEFVKDREIFGGTKTIYSVRADLNFDFFNWLADRCESMRGDK